jgi:hypothetical protein
MLVVFDDDGCAKLLIADYRAMMGVTDGSRTRDIDIFQVLQWLL